MPDEVSAAADSLPLDTHPRRAGQIISCAGNDGQLKRVHSPWFFLLLDIRTWQAGICLRMQRDDLLSVADDSEPQPTAVLQHDVRPVPIAPSLVLAAAAWHNR